MNVTVFDYGAGNLHSLAKALERVGASVRVETDARRALDGAALVLPGVGAFGAAAERLSSGRDVMRAALANGLPALGVCLGMQLLMDGSDEGEGAGLGLIPGRVRMIEAKRRPHMGWNDVEFDVEFKDVEFKDVESTVVESADAERAAAPGPRTPISKDLLAYFAHSYVCEPRDSGCVRAWSTHESDRFPAVVSMARTTGVQFHPEKSGPGGLALLAAWLQDVRSPRAKS